MKNEKGLLGEFTCTGMWWLPHNPSEKIYGTLKFNHNYIELNVSGVFSKKYTFQRLKPEIIHGLTNKNEKLTLYQVSELYFEEPLILESNSKNNFGESIFSCEYIFIGKHFNHQSDIMFKKLYANYTYLNEWINSKLEYKYYDNNFNIKTEPFNYNLNIESIKATLQISSDARDFGNFKTDIRIYYVSYMLITPSEARNWKWFKGFTDNLKNLLTLLFGVPVYPTHLSGELIDGSEFESVEIYYSIPNPIIIEDIHPWNIDLSFKKIIEYANRDNQTVADIIDNWFTENEIIAPVFDLFFLTFYDDSMSARTFFLTLIQAIETFHRRTHIDEKYMDDDTYAPLYKTVISAIPDELDQSFKKRLEGMLKFGNELSLKTRLEMLQKGGRGELKWFDVIMRDEKGIIRKLVDTRNYYTHFSVSNKKNMISDEDLPRINNKLRLFLRVLLIEQIDPKGVLPVSDIVDPFMRAIKTEKDLLKISQR